MSEPLNICVITQYLENSYHGSLIYAIQQELLRQNARMFIINTFMIYKLCRGEEKDIIYSKLALNHIDGWIVLAESASNQYIEVLRQTGKPVVTVSFKPEGVQCGSICEESRYNAEMVTQHLVDHGHKKIAFLYSPLLADMVERFEGYKNALEKNGIPFNRSLVITVDPPMTQYGKIAMQKKYSTEYDFTAVFAANDYLALGVIEASKEAGLRVPEDIAVIGYDDIVYAKISKPGLTTVRQDLAGIGTKAAEYLIKSIRENNLLNEVIFVKSNLIIRNSCGCTEQPENNNISYKDEIEIKNTMIEHLENELGRNYNVSMQLLTMSIDDIKKVFPNIANGYPLQCIGYWDEGNGAEKKLSIGQIINVRTKTAIDINSVCSINEFPPSEFMSYLNEENIEDVVWLLPLSTDTRDWCTIAYAGPYDKTNSMFAYDSWNILFYLIGIFLEHEMTNAELKNTLEKLKQTLDTLKQTQEKLIQSEKMVSLGRLVAGVAHEINTPIGVSITAASYMQERSRELLELFQSGKLKRSDMEDFFQISTETLDILRINLNKASNLVKSFKQIAVDQSFEEKRRFKLKGYIEDVLLSLSPRLKKTRITVDIDCDEGLEIYSYPDGFSQIITNLIMNSIIHAYEEDEKGVITIKISRENSVINFIYSDDGKGIEKDNLNKIFEPFYTTKRGSGGTGLGLNVVYNVVTQQYGGSIKCESVYGNGATFIIEIPIEEI
jgi:DNA-binding LacI/PurR family transcriptional regulator/signal transduction histidine kinase